MPDALPPKPSLKLNSDLQDLMDRALLFLGRLDSVTLLLPDTALFLYSYVRKEAVLSAQIEGTQSSLSDLLLFEMKGMPGVPIDDVQEASNYVAAIEHGIMRLKEGFPLSLRLIKEIHKILLSKGRGARRNPGEFRKSQNWVGGTRPGNASYVPTPADMVMQCMGDLEKFLHNEPERVPVLIKTALSHVQFESIHPFLDGNGRLGRLLITLILCHEEVLKEPMLYLSLFFKTNRDEYYERLQNVRTDGDWDGWLQFFFHAVIETAAQAVKTTHDLMALAEEDRKRIQTIGKASGSALTVHHSLIQRPVISIQKVCEISGLQPNTVNSALKKLIELGLVSELSGKKRGRLFGYTNYITVLGEGT